MRKCIYFFIIIAALGAAASGAQLPAQEEIESLHADVRAANELLRGRNFKTDVPVVAVSAEQAREYSAAVAGLLFPYAGGVESTADAWEFLRLIPPGYDLERTVAEFSAGRTRAFYDPEGKRIVLAVDMQTPGWNEPLIIKTMEVLRVDELEFVLTLQHGYALLDSAFDVYRKAGGADSFDRKMAALALINGDATLTAMDYLVRNYGVSILLLPNPEAVVNQFLPLVMYAERSSLEAAPDAVREDLMFQFAKGVKFAHSLRKTDGLPLLDSAYASLPLSTEQILHPEKFYEKRDNPVEVEVPDLCEVLPEGSKLLYSDVLGEWGIRRMLGEWLGGGGETESASAGWGGDRFVLYGLPGGGRVGAMFTTWDSAGAAEMFHGVFRRASRAAYGDSAAVETSIIGREVAAVIAPDRDTALRASELLWQSTRSPVVVPPPVPEKRDPELILTDLSEFMGMFVDTKPVQPPPSETWDVKADKFTNQKYLYSVTRPNENWMFQRLHLGNQFVSELTAVNTQSLGANFTIFSFEKYGPESENPVDQMVDFMAAQMTGFKRLGEKQVTVAGFPARSVTFTGNVFVPLKITYTEIYAKNYNHIVTWWALKTNYEKLLPEFKEFLDSFTVLER